MSQRSMMQALFAHSDWARDKLLDAAASLSDEALDRQFEIGPGTLRATLYHLWAAEHVWLGRWLGQWDRSALEEQPAWPIDRLRQRSLETARERDAFVADLGDRGLSTMISYVGPQDVRYTQPVGELMMHVCSHAVHHRAQAANMLRQLGAKPPRLDYIFMLIDQSPPPREFDGARLRRAIAYGDWATARVLALAETLSDDVLDRPIEMGVGSLRKTLLHIHDAEAWWFQNWTGEPAGSFTELPGSTSLASLRERTRESSEGRDRFLASMDAAGLRRIVVARPRPDRELRFAIGDSMLQLFVHGTHHRAQAVNMLRRAGLTPPRVDYVVWVREGH